MARAKTSTCKHRWQSGCSHLSLTRSCGKCEVIEFRVSVWKGSRYVWTKWQKVKKGR